MAPDRVDFSFPFSFLVQQSRLDNCLFIWLLIDCLLTLQVTVRVVERGFCQLS